MMNLLVGTIRLAVKELVLSCFLTLNVSCGLNSTTVIFLKLVRLVTHPRILISCVACCTTPHITFSAYVSMYALFSDLSPDDSLPSVVVNEYLI